MRARAHAILLDLERSAGFAAEHLRAADPPFVRELVLGVLRRRATLDAVQDAFGRRRSESLEPEVRVALRLGILQILFLDGVRPHAAVSETVALLAGSGRRAYANAVLRTLLRESHKVSPDEDRGGAHASKRLERPGRAVVFFSRPVFPDPCDDRLGWLAAVHSHPRFLVERWVARWGEAAAVARLEAGNEPPALVLRPRHGRLEAEALVARLAGEGVPAGVLPREGGADAVRVAGWPRKLFRGAAWRAGLFSVQDPEQMDAVEILAPRPGEVVWDACAAPGGKAAQIAERLAGRGQVVATDRDERRLELVAESVVRLGLEGLTVAPHDLLKGGAPPHRPARGFDAILLDAPCSNTAVLARRPEARWRLRPETFAELALLQRRLLAAAAAHLSPGGRLVYSVCSCEPEEGEGHGLVPTRSPLVWLGGGSA